jgi:N-acetylglucosamine-6-phosphate deacetylase
MHDASLMVTAESLAPEVCYGKFATTSDIVKLVTTAPELPGSQSMIKKFVSQSTRVSLGHSSATFEQGLSGLSYGATGLTHVMNCMAPFHHREPGLAGLISLPVSNSPPPPYYALIADGAHMHPQVASILYKANPSRTMLVSDSTDLTGLPDGHYRGREKRNGAVVIEGTDTLAGSCVSVDQCVRNLMSWTGCNIAEAVHTVTETVASFMGLEDRGKLEPGRRADFVVLDDEGHVRETWIAGVKVWET